LTKSIWCCTPSQPGRDANRRVAERAGRRVDGDPHAVVGKRGDNVGGALG
jgi:hypothetical protein